MPSPRARIGPGGRSGVPADRRSQADRFSRARARDTCLCHRPQPRAKRARRAWFAAGFVKTERQDETVLLAESLARIEAELADLKRHLSIE